MFLGGPAIALFFIACLALLFLIAVLLGRAEALAALGRRAVRRLERSRILPTLWGLAASVLITLLFVILFQTHVLALLGLMVLIAGFMLIALGLGVAALSLGRRLASHLGRSDTFTALLIGLLACLLSMLIPFLGWFVVLLAAASGVGAVVEALLTKVEEKP